MVAGNLIKISKFSSTKKQLHVDQYIAILLYTNIDLKLRIKQHGPIHCKISLKMEENFSHTC